MSRSAKKKALSFRRCVEALRQSQGIRPSHLNGSDYNVSVRHGPCNMWDGCEHSATQMD